MKNGSRASSRNAFTMLELVVVIGVIGILAALLLPAIQHARESSRLNNCLNNLRQLGLAIRSFETATNLIPGNGQKGINSYFTSRAGERVQLTTTLGGDEFAWGIGDPNIDTLNQPGCWAYAILPYVEQQVAYQNVSFQLRQPLYLCPTKARPKPLPTVDDEVAQYESGGFPWARTDYALNGIASTFLPHFDMSGPYPLSFYERGASLDNLVLLGEKAYNKAIQRPTNWYYDEPLFSGASFGTIKTGTKLSRDGEQADFRFGYGASHSAGVNFVFFSGRVSTLAYETDEVTWRELQRAKLSPYDTLGL